MNNVCLHDFNYIIKAQITINENVEVEEVGLSWLKVKNKNLFIKTINVTDSQNDYKISIKNKDRNVPVQMDSDSIINIGLTYKNKITVLELTKLEERSSVQTSYIKIRCNNNGFKIMENSHYTCENSVSISHHDIFIDANINTWFKWNDDFNHLNNIATTERCDCFEEKDHDFRKWYANQAKRCCYCGIEEEELKKYFHEDNKQTSKATARGRGAWLEIERILTVPEENFYYPNNTDLACYICNNAKSDFISAKDFQPIAKGINQFWKKQEGVTIEDFDDKAKIWEMDT